MAYRYRMCGLTVASELKLDGAWPDMPDSAAPPDVVMRAGEVAQGLESPLVSRRAWDADANSLLLRGEGVGRFLITGGNTVLFEAEDGVSPEECAVYLQGTVIGMLLHQRGGIVLHASSVAVSGRAVLFCGVSGEGKSTLAAFLSKHGYPVVSDDVCLVSFDDSDVPFVTTDARKLKLTEASITAAGLESERGQPVLGFTGKSYITPTVRWNGSDLAIGAIYFLQSRDIPAITPLAAGDALQNLCRNAHRPGLVRSTGHAPRYFQASARILSHAPAFVLSRRRELLDIDVTITALESHWGEIGLAQQKENIDA